MALRRALLAGAKQQFAAAPSCVFYKKQPVRTIPATAATYGPARCVATAQRKPLFGGDSERIWRSGKPTRRQAQRFRRRKFLHDSPSATLALRLESRSTALTFEAWKRFDDVARSQSMRLPVIALQMLLRQDEAQQRTSLSDSLCSPDSWRTRLNSLAFKGITEGDIQHWLWILSAPGPDERVARFVAEDERPKPIFLLFQLLRRDETFHKGHSLMSVYNYIARHHVHSRKRTLESEPPFGAVRRAMDPALNMTPATFAMLLRLLVYHYLRLWPSALPAVARLVVAYVETLPCMVKRGDQQAFKDACRIFNCALVLFQRKSPVSPLFQMRYNWRAQKELLAMSSTLPRALVINRAGFRAIRRVLLALGKSPAERTVALRMARTWPPYRRDWDGRDEQRQPQDDFSRSAQAGALMREAGYAETEHDRALGALGGVMPGESPTVQTRSLSPRTWTGSRASLNVFSTWAARVKATRDVNEAWYEFQTAPASTDGSRSTLRPNIQVYAEMFKKLVALPVDFCFTTAGSLSHAGQAVGQHGKELLPGDAKEVYPVNDAALTAFEKQRLRPPTLDVLYEQMLRDDIRPVGDCLSVLVQNAPTLDTGLTYLHDSPLDKAALGALELPKASRISPSQKISIDEQSSPFSTSRRASRRLQRQQPQEPEQPITLELLRNIPLSNLCAYVHLMCRFQPRLTAEAARLGKQRRTALIHHAIQLSARRLPPSIAEGRTYKATWHTIMRTLAQPKLMVSPQHTNDRRFHDTEALYLALRVFDQVSQAGGVDVIMFDSLCKVMQKTLRWTCSVPWTAAADTKEDLFENVTPSLSPTLSSHPIEQRQRELLQTAHASLVAAFDDMTLLSHSDKGLTSSSGSRSPIPAPHHPATPYNITAGMMQSYLQTLGYLGDTKAMTRVIHWVLDTWNDWTVLEDAKNPDDSQHATMGRVFVMYRAFVEGTETVAEGGAPGPQVASIENKLLQLQRQGCTWRWPSSYDADEYVRWHRQEYNEAFWARARPGA
ncbi:hypothetical protein SEPCBS119000_000807 [Sporothrix epigloea]|uniref:Prefoldin subunit n=1 Tax=Sporothrix epigloea TaxID=1892477 RepID=A0ABP0DB05_9PEZI